MKTRITLLLVTLFGMTIMQAQDYQLNGNLGVGTNPEKKLDVDGDTKLRGDAEVEGTLKLKDLESTGTGLSERLIYADDEGNLKKLGPDDWIVLFNQGYDGWCDDVPSNALPVWKNSTGSMLLCSPSAKLGVGLTNPLAQLHLGGDAIINGGLRSATLTLGENLFHVGNTGMVQTRSADGDLWQAMTADGDMRYRFRANGALKTYLADDAPSAFEAIKGGEEIFRLDVDGSYRSVLASDANNALRVYQHNGTEEEIRFKVSSTGSVQTHLTQAASSAFEAFAPDGTELFRMHADGNFYAHEVHTEKVVVELDPFPDYVFEEDYELMPLHELQKFIASNKHLPGMPTAKTIEEQGGDLGEMNRLLVEKVEELTLYVLQLQEQVDELKKQEK